MAAYQVVIFAVLVSLSASHPENSPYNLDRLREMFLANQGASSTTEKPDNPMDNPDPRVAHSDFLVGRFDLASGTSCKSDECRTLAKRLQSLIIDYNVKVIGYIGDNFPYEDFKYEYTPLNFKSIDIIVVTVYYRMLPPSGNGTTSSSTDRPRPTTRPTGPTDRTPDTSRPTTPSTTTTEATTTTMSTSSTSPTIKASTTTSSGSFYSCSFEDNSLPNELCGAVQDSSDHFNWTRYTGGTVSGGTGPNGAFNEDYYLYIEASNPREDGDNARLVLPANTGAAASFCVRFYYHMLGQHTGTLQVIILDSNGSDAVKWVRNGAQGTEWISGGVNVFVETGASIVFEGVTGGEYQGDIAIDLVIVDGDLSQCPIN